MAAPNHRLAPANHYLLPANYSLLPPNNKKVKGDARTKRTLASNIACCKRTMALVVSLCSDLMTTA
ncbi:hypothetical protein [Alloprevotella tannerae]|uniref:hypothetical protein n=1 Tax=Alloprevotella tannerae TaxID=76122 RepID=UPI0028EE634A|nr:hypothetical protein [Alloprevotella tannerae]